MVAFSVVITEIARACASTAVTMSVSNMVCEVIQSVGSEEQRNRYIPLICSGQYPAGGFALTETGAGSDAAAIRTTAKRDGDSWIPERQARFSSQARNTRACLLVWAVTDSTAPKGKGISVFLVENGALGLTIWSCRKQDGAATFRHEPTRVRGLSHPCQCPDGQAQPGLPRCYRRAGRRTHRHRVSGLGIGKRRWNTPSHMPRTASSSTSPSRNFQAIQWMIAESHTELEAARLLLMLAASKKEKGLAFSREASMAKFYATEAAERACTTRCRCSAGMGTQRSSPSSVSTAMSGSPRLYEEPTRFKGLWLRAICSQPQSETGAVLSLQLSAVSRESRAASILLTSVVWSESA